MEHYRTIDTRLGTFAVFQHAETGAMRSAWLSDGNGVGEAQRDDALAGDLFALLERYFAGEIIDFAAIDTPPGPPFYRACWNACRRIPSGETRSYLDLATAAGSPAAARAAGQAMRHNPLPVIVPCHRVIGSDGELHGFAGTCDPTSEPLTLKMRLLELEGAIASV